MSFRERLPEGCPPTEAYGLLETLTVFRLVWGDPPSDDDFKSQRAERPGNQFDVSECQARGLSVFSDARDAKKRLKLPKFKGRMLCTVTLDKGAGYIQRTNRMSHLTWWPLADFDILAACRMVDV